MMPLLFTSRIAVLCFASVCLAEQHCLVADSSASCSNAEGQPIHQDEHDQVALLQEVASTPSAHVDTQLSPPKASRGWRRAGPPRSAQSDAVLVQTAAQTNSSRSRSARPADVDLGASAAGIVADVRASLVDLAPAVKAAVQQAELEEERAEEEAGGPDAEGFTSWLPAEHAAEAAAKEEASVAEATLEEFEEVPAELSKLGKRSASALDYISLLITSHLPTSSYPTLLTAIPVAIAFLVLAAAFLMVILSTLKSWGGMFYCVSGSSSAAPGQRPSLLLGVGAERPNPLQALRVLRLNLSDRVGRGNGQP